MQSLWIALPFLVVCLFPGSGLFGQATFDAGLSVYVDYTFSQFDQAGMNGFVSSFNEFWGNELRQGFDSLNGQELSHPHVGLGVRFGNQAKVGFTAASHLLGGRGSFTRSCLWQNGVSQEMRLRATDLQWSFNMGIHIRNVFFLEGFTAANGRWLNLAYTTTYQDGSQSISSEYKLNGLYTGLMASFDYGIQAGLRMGPILVMARWNRAAKSFPPGKGLVNLDDYDSNNFPPTEFPSNYESYAIDPIGFVERDEGVKTDSFEGSKWVIAVEFLLGADFRQP